MDCSPAASSGAPEGLGACGRKPAFNLWLQEGMTLLSAGRGPARRHPVKDGTENGASSQRCRAAPAAPDANLYKRGDKAERKR